MLGLQAQHFLSTSRSHRRCHRGCVQVGTRCGASNTGSRQLACRHRADLCRRLYRGLRREDRRKNHRTCSKMAVGGFQRERTGTDFVGAGGRGSSADELHRPGGRRRAGILPCHELGLHAQYPNPRDRSLKNKKSYTPFFQALTSTHPCQTNRKSEPSLLQCERKVAKEKALLPVQ